MIGGIQGICLYPDAFDGAKVLKHVGSEITV